MYDVIIIGAGPAGATLARLLPERRILLVDARGVSAADGREKCCGGLLAPDAARMLSRMGLELPGRVRDSGQPLAVRALDLVSGRSRLYPRPYVNLHRPAFEQWLLSLLPENVTLLERHTCLGVEPFRDGAGWEAVLKGQCGTLREKGAMIVGADGAGSVVRRALGAPPRPWIRYLAVQDCFAGESAGHCGGQGDGEYVAFFHPGLTDFYGWVIPKRERVLLGLATPLGTGRRRDKPPHALLDAARAQLEKYGCRFSGTVERQASLLLRPSHRDVFLGADGAWCVGEAAGFISPSSAEGYSYAFASALALAKALATGGTAAGIRRAYRRRTAPLIINLALKQCKAGVMFNPFLRDLIMRSGFLSAK